MKYNISKTNQNMILTRIKKELQQSKTTLEDLSVIDNKYCDIKVSFEGLENILDKLKNEKIDIRNEQKILIIYNGSPAITLNLSILAILTRTTIVLDFNQNMLGVNTFIINLINEILSEFETDQFIYIKKQINADYENADKIICIDDIHKYNEYLRNNIKKARFYSLNYLDFYSDNDEFGDITELIYKYAEDNQISIESYSELGAEEAAEMMKNGYGRCAVVLTKNKEVKQVFETKIKNKKIYINKNPYDEPTRLLNKEIFYI